ncbi:MAG: ABC transporter ATP-binding protein [Anaerolineae bacterium]|nr:ABC transporter ATP-binding protein [Anaerolineae bacterium]
MLRVEDLNVYYGEAVHALRNVSFEVQEGEILSIIGANGAGKSTLMWTLIGQLKPRSGKITFRGEVMKPVPHAVVSAGMALVPERRRLFPNLTVRENLMMGAYLRGDRGAVQKDLEYIFSLFPILKERLNQYAGTLSGGQQQMVATARGLMSRPKLLLMDEPSLGLAPILVNQIFETIQEISRQGTTILLVEQNAKKSLAIAHRAYVLEVGCIVRTGTGQELLNDPAVQAAYLGVSQHKEVILEGKEPC